MRMMTTKMRWRWFAIRWQYHVIIFEDSYFTCNVSHSSITAITAASRVNSSSDPRWRQTLVVVVVPNVPNTCCVDVSHTT